MIAINVRIAKRVGRLPTNQPVSQAIVAVVIVVMDLDLL